MPTANYRKAREQLRQACKLYIAHSKAQLAALPVESPSYPEDSFFMMALSNVVSPDGFIGWVACKYYHILENIIRLDNQGASPYNNYYARFYPPLEGKMKFFPDEGYGITIGPEYFNLADYLNPEILLNRIDVLDGLLQNIMIHRNKAPNFTKKLQEYQNASERYKCLDSDPLSVKTYKALHNLKRLASFISTLPDYQSQGTYLHSIINRSLPIFEGYLKWAAVQELKATLDNKELSDEASIKAIESQLSNKIFVEILEKNRQSQAEHIFKIISAVLIPLGIGIISTAILAGKRLYDTHGASMNFFKPLSHNLYDELEDVTATIEPS